MPDNDYITAYDDFKKHALSEEIEKITYLFYEQQAAELELPLDYYMQEFVLD